MSTLTDTDILRIRDESFSTLSQNGVVLGHESDVAFARAILATRASEYAKPDAYVNGDELDNMLDDRVAIIQGTRSSHRRTPLFRESAPVASKEAVTLSDEEFALFARTEDQFGDCNETDTAYETLMRWANLGLLECEHFTVTGAGRSLLDQRDASKAEGQS